MLERTLTDGSFIPRILIQLKKLIEINLQLPLMVSSELYTHFFGNENDDYCLIQLERK